MNQFTIHPSLRFVSIGKILTSDSIKLDGESLAREKEYTKALQTFGKNNSIKPKNWDAELKMKDLNATDLEAAMRIVAGTARSMGIQVEKG